MKDKVWGEIVYELDTTVVVHSDFHSHQPREYLHKMLDEWLDRSNGTGAFYIGNADAREALK